jgi:RNA-directed DNA polymerase
VRYADDFVVMARYVGSRLQGFIESKIEARLDLKVNREKTRCVDLRLEGTHLDFLGFTFSYDRDLRGRAHRYWNVQPSKKALAREREVIREKTSPSMCFKPIDDMIGEINMHLKGWANYFRFGYPRKAFRNVNWYVRRKLTRHLKRRSQRPMRPPKGTTYYSHFKTMGLVYL